MSPTPHELRAELLVRLAEPDLDVVRASERVAAARAGRRRRRRTRASAVAAAVVVALAGGALAVGAGSGEELLADASDATPTTTTTSTTTTEVAAAPPDAPPTVAAGDAGDVAAALETPLTSDEPSRESSAPPAVRGNATLPAAPPTSPTVPVPPPRRDEPLTARITPLDPAPAAGSPVTFEIAWLDADHVGGPPVVSVDWGDPLLQLTRTGPERLDCSTPARPAGSVEQVNVRFAVPGRRVVRAEVVGCDGPTGAAQRTVAEVELQVGGPILDGIPARAVVAHVAPGDVPAAPLDQAVAAFRRGDGTVVGLGQRRPTIDQRAGGGPATVLVVPGSAAGRLELHWPGRDCRAVGDLSASPLGTARLVPLVLSC